MVKALLNLPPKGRLQRARTIEKEFFNPHSIDIFTEDEAAYNAHLLRKQHQKCDGTEARDDDYHIVLNAAHEKGRRTLQVLISHILNNANNEEAIDEASIFLQQPSIDHTISPLNSSMKKNILSRKNYLKVNSNTVIKLLLRCKKLYQAMTEIKKILQLILK